MGTDKIVQQAWDLGVLVTFMIISEGGCGLLGDHAQRSRAETMFNFTLLRAQPKHYAAARSQPTTYSRWVGIGLQKVR